MEALEEEHDRPERHQHGADGREEGPRRGGCSRGTRQCDEGQRGHEHPDVMCQERGRWSNTLLAPYARQQGYVDTGTTVVSVGGEWRDLLRPDRARSCRGCAVAVPCRLKGETWPRHPLLQCGNNRILPYGVAPRPISHVQGVWLRVPFLSAEGASYHERRRSSASQISK